MKEAQIANIGIGMVDVVVDVGKDTTRYQKLQEVLGLSPGGWVEIPDQDALRDTLQIITSREINVPLTNFAALKRTSGLSLYAGSTGLSVLSAFDPGQRRNSTIYAAAGATEEGRLDATAKLFGRETRKLGLNYAPSLKIGASPLGFVISCDDNPDKMLATYKGVASEVDSFIPNPQPNLLIVDSYELLQGNITKTIKDFIRKSNIQVAIGLSNENILSPQLIEYFYELFRSNKDITLYGNREEYAKLLNLPSEEVTIERLRELHLEDMIQSCLITLGSEGLIGMHKGEYTYKPAIPIDKIVNTDGAGDTAAGVFISGLLYNKPMEAILDDAAYYVSIVIQQKEGKITGGRK